MSSKKHLVVICGQHYPTPSPTALCAERYALLFKEEYDIDFISQTENGLGETVLLPSGIKSNTVTCRRLRWEKKSPPFVSKMIHAYGSLLLFTNLLGNQEWFRKAAFRRLEEIHRQHPVDVVFSICSPMAAIWAGIDFKKRHPLVRLCSYTVDPYSTPDRVRPVFQSQASLLNFERRALAAVDWSLLSEEVYNTRIDIREGLKHCSPLPYLTPPFLTDEEYDGKEHKRAETVVCVYAGSFYDNIRNPDYLLRVFSQLVYDNIQLHLYSKGCEKIVETYAKCHNIVVRGMVSQAELRETYLAADVLIGVGNSVSDFLPSKTFEYISLRKPIIYFNYEGIPNTVLNDYPCSLQLSDAMPVNLAAASVKSFCDKLPNGLVERKQLEIIYKKHSSESIKEEITKAFNQSK